MDGGLAQRRRGAARLVALVLVLALAGCGGDDDTAPPDEAATVAKSVAGAESEISVGVDRRVELLTLLNHLAAVPPYEQSLTPYAQAADAEFARFTGHPAVAATRQLAADHGISYDAPVELAAYLDGSLSPARPLDPLPPGLDPRWKGVDIDAYLRDIRRFAAESGFDDFYESEAPYHRAVEGAYRDLLAERPTVDWFDGAFGPRRDASYTLVPGLLTGDFSFSTTAETEDEELEVAQITFLEQPDAEGIPHPTTLTYSNIVHELAHSYVNPIFDARVEEMRATGEPLFEQVEDAMREQAYTTYPIMVNESIVRALTVLFLRERVGEADAQRNLDEQIELSFAWTPELVEAIDELRSENGGRLDEEELVEATQGVFAEWLDAHP